MKIDEQNRSPSEIVQNYLFERGIDMPDDMKEEYDISFNPNLNQKIVKDYVAPSTKLNSKQKMQE